MLGAAATKTQQARFRMMQESGCVPCWLESKLQGRKHVPEPPDIHHVDQDNHARTYSNCPWHHRGIPKTPFSESIMRENFGPSMAKEPARYRMRYGTEEDLLRYQETILQAHIRKWHRAGASVL